MKVTTSILLLVSALLLPGLLRAETVSDPATAIIGTWVIDDEDSWNQFSKSPQWEAMTPDQRVTFRSTIWPKALEKLLFTAYHFSQQQIVIAHKETQLRIPAIYSGSGRNQVTVVMGEGGSRTTMTITFLDANHINIRAANETQPNFYVWQRRGKAAN